MFKDIAVDEKIEQSDKLLRVFNIVDSGIRDKKEISLWDIITMAYDLGFEDRVKSSNEDCVEGY